MDSKTAPDISRAGVLTKAESFHARFHPSLPVQGTFGSKKYSINLEWMPVTHGHRTEESETNPNGSG
jgi:hypothetical protein